MIHNEETLMKIGTEGPYLKLIEATRNKLMVNVTLDGETESTSSKIRNETRCPVSRLLYKQYLKL